MTYELETINSAIADTLAGNGDFEQLKRFESQKRDILDRRHFDRLGELRERIRELNDERETARMVRDDLHADLKSTGATIDRIHIELEAAERGHREITARLFYLDSVIDTNRKTVAEIERELEQTIKSKIKEVTSL